MTPEAEYRPGPPGSPVDGSGKVAHRVLARAAGDIATRWRERRFARRGAKRVLKAYRIVRELHPELKGESLYVASLTSATGLDEIKARARVTLATRSFASWPEPRAVRLRDVIEYVVVADYMAREPKPWGVQTDMGKVVASIVPANL